jgi:hypothetical protein
MKKIFTFICILAALQVSAVTVSDVAGVFKGTLNVGSQSYSDKEIYVLPGTASNSVTLVLPGVGFSSKSEDLVLVNMGMNSSGNLSAGSAAAYVQQISASSLSASSASFTMSVVTPAQTTPTTVTFSGSKVTDKNYAITNGGFEGSWSNHEPTGWHSFGTATGSKKSYVTSNYDQFTQSTDVRPGSTGSYSGHLQSKYILIAKANGTCTNGQVNAGSTSASSTSNNNFSDPSNTGYNTPFVGNPDSLVFWAKYIPVTGSNSTQARARAVVTTATKYQDPEISSCADARIADATINYDPTSNWKRLSVPFNYSEVDRTTAAYMLITFTTNAVAAGGNTTSSKVDNLYIDDAEMIYNHALSTFKLDNQAISFTNGKAASTQLYSDEYTAAVTSNGKAAKSFVGYDIVNHQVHVYVVADNYSQAGGYNAYTVQMAFNTEYEYSATLCANELPYSDELFENLTEASEYTATIPNTHGGDSVVTLTLSILPTYSSEESMTIYVGAKETWEGYDLSLYPVGNKDLTRSLKTQAGCDSTLVLHLTVEPRPTTYGYYTATTCDNEPYSDELFQNLTEAGEYTTKIKNILGGDSVITLTLSILPTYTAEESMTIYVGAEEQWEGYDLSTYPVGKTDLKATYTQTNGCDSTLILHLTVEPKGEYAYSATTCDNEPYSDEYFQNLTEAGEYTTTVKDAQGVETIVTLTLTTLPTYRIEENMTIFAGEKKTWQTYDLSKIRVGTKTLKASFKTQAGCDSVMVLHLTIEPRPVTEYAYSATTCDNEPYSDELFQNLSEAGEYKVTIPNAQGGDSIVTLTLNILPTYTAENSMTIIEGDEKTWEDYDLSTYPVGETDLTATYTALNGCDSTLTLHLIVEKRVATGNAEAQQSKRAVRKQVIDGQLFIIKEDETMYDILGTKIK